MTRQHLRIFICQTKVLEFIYEVIDHHLNCSPSLSSLNTK